MAALGTGIFFASAPVSQAVSNAQHGTVVDLSGLDTDTYQVDAVWQKADGSYLVQSHAKGFQSTITVESLFSEDASSVRSIRIVSQGDTQGIGSQITESGFAEQFADKAMPVRVKDMAVESPGGNAGISEDAAELTVSGPVGDPNRWNSQDQSAEADAYRNLYLAGLTESAYEGQELTTPVADMSPEEKAEYEMIRAGLSTKNATGSDLIRTSRSTATVQATDVDGISSATFSSVGAATAVNNAYYFVHEQLMK